MRNRIFFASIFFTLTISATSQDITGKWLGFIATGGANIRFIMNLTKTADTYQATFDSPDQKAFGISGSRTTVTNDSVMADISVMRAGYKGKWDGKDAIAGVFHQGAITLTLNMKRMTEEEKSKLPQLKERPQTPKPPFNYDKEDIEYDNADQTVHYGATFTKPKNLQSFPTVIIISGSGSQDRDGTILGHKLYAVLGDYLTNHGIGVLRVDDRGMGKSTLGNDPKSLTSAVFSTDVEASLNYLLSRTDLDKKKIGLIGHSEGGIIAPMVAARRKEISFIILWGAPVVGGLLLNTEQNAYSLKKSGMDSDAVNAFAELHKKILSQFTTTSKEELNNKVDILFNEWKAAQKKETLTALYVTDNGMVGQDIHKMYHSLYDPEWMRFFITYNPASDLAKVSCPVLAINGTKDTQVDAKANLSAIQTILTRSGNKNFQTTPLESLNHLLQTAQTGDLDEYEKLDETISPSAMEVIANWIRAQIK